MRVLALGISVAVSLCLLEGAVRIRQWVKYGSSSPTVHAFVEDPVSGLSIPQPGMKRSGITINALGFRGPELEVPKPPGTLRIVFLGGSTTYCAEVSSDEMTWPALVTKELARRHPELTFDYVNGGVPGYSTAQSLINLDTRIAPLEPDVIVIYHGTNDLSSDTRQLAKERGVWEGPPESTGWLARRSTLWFLLEKNWTIYRRQQNAQRMLNRLDFDARELSRDFESRLSKLIERSKQITPHVAVATFSHRIRHEQTDEQKLRASNTSLYYMPYMSVEGLLAGFDEYNRVIRSVAKAQDVRIIEDELSVPGDGEHFMDSVHFTDEGSRKMADRVVPVLDEMVDTCRTP